MDLCCSSCNMLGFWEAWILHRGTGESKEGDLLHWLPMCSWQEIWEIKNIQKQRARNKKTGTSSKGLCLLGQSRQEVVFACSGLMALLGLPGTRSQLSAKIKIPFFYSNPDVLKKPNCWKILIRFPKLVRCSYTHQPYFCFQMLWVLTIPSIS